MDNLSDNISLNCINFNEFLPVAIIYYYYKTNDILFPEFFSNYYYSNYFV